MTANANEHVIHDEGDVPPIIDPSTVIKDVEIADNHNNTTAVNNIATEEVGAVSCNRRQQLRQATAAFIWKYDFPFLILCAIALAWIYPPLGAEYVAPKYTAWISVSVIFFIAGLSVRSEEFSKAISRVYYNTFVLSYIFGVVSVIGFGFSRFLIAVDFLPKTLADGLVIVSCLPISINVSIVLSSASGGDLAAAIFHTAVSNVLGIFLSPVLILGYLGSEGSIPLGQVFMKLSLQVAAPLVIGQILRLVSMAVREFQYKHKIWLLKAQEYLLVFIVYTIFCKGFNAGRRSSIGNVFLLILYIFLFITFLKVLAWYSLRYFFPNEPELQVTGLFCCAHKTIALGVPLISALYAGNPNLAVYTLPILIWHPMQLVYGSLLVPRLSKYIVDERERRIQEQNNIQSIGESTIEMPTVVHPRPVAFAKIEDATPDD